jgi:thiol-disulfide isomerase/thioredoxin
MAGSSAAARAALSVLLAAGPLSGCAAKRLDALEERLVRIERLAFGPSEEEERAAFQELEPMMRLVSETPPAGLAATGVRERLVEFLRVYDGTQAADLARNLLDQVQVLGKPVTSLAVDVWLQGQGDLTAAPVTLLAFWEVWCPHCQREVPKLTDWVTRYGGNGLQVISLTSQSRGVTADDVLTFARENGVTFPIGHETGATSDILGIEGIPAAAAIRDGIVIWRGHPGELNDTIVGGWLQP